MAAWLSPNRLTSTFSMAGAVLLSLLCAREMVCWSLLCESEVGLYVFRLSSIDGRSTQQHWYAPRIDGMGERESGHVLSAGMTCKMILS